MSTELTIGFLPLVDACLPILAREHGFAEAEGLSLRLVKDMSWATVLDRLLYGHSDAAHLVAPLALAVTLGRSRPAQPLSVPFVLELNGNAITMRPGLAARVATPGELGDPARVGGALAIEARARAQSGSPLRFGVVHRYSSHNYKLRYWLAACGIRPDHDVEITTVAPPYCTDALETGEVDAICVGEPWNSVAVERGVGVIALASAQIWRRGVVKVLALREPVLEDRRGSVEGLILLANGSTRFTPAVRSMSWCWTWTAALAPLMASRRARPTMATSAAPAIIRCSCSTSSAIWNGPACAPAMFTAPMAGGRCWNRWWRAIAIR
jgi:ABC-type nitrate/sulfonate/bicarbonate transport system substrate-binding protein